jgi:O-antigen/teichoic acid export membrane protein
MPMTEVQPHSPGVFASNVAWTIAGRVLPILVTLAAIPTLLDRLGEDQFGLLLIMVMFIGYFNVLDLGIPRAIIYFLSRPDYDQAKQHAFIRTSTTLLLLISVFVAVLLLFLTDALITSWLTIAPEFHGESRLSMYLVALSLPVLTVTTLYRGILERHHAFPVLNRYMIFFGTLNFGLPLLIVLLFEPRLSYVVAAMIASRMGNGIAMYVTSRRYITGLSLWLGIHRDYLMPLLRYSGWITLSNVFIPIISNADRFIIGILLTMSAVTYYTTPLEVTAKLSVLTFSFVTVLFPTFASLFKTNREKAEQVYHMTAKMLLGIGFFSCINIMLLADPLLTWYIDAAFSAQSAVVLKILCLSLFVNTLAFIPSTFLQSAGRPDVTALTSVFIGVLTVGALYFGISAAGIEGAAWARLAVLTLDTLILTVMTRSIFAVKTTSGYLTGLVVAPVVLALAYLLPSTVSFWLYSLPVQLALAGGFLFGVFSASERQSLFGLIESARFRIAGK